MKLDNPIGEVLTDGMFLIAHLQKLKQGAVSLESFEQLKVIGRGGFSKVVLARKKDSGELYAIKIMSKSTVKNKTQRVLAERNIMAGLDCPYMLKLHWAF